MFRQSDIIKMAKRRGFGLEVVSDNVYMLKKNGDDVWHKVNGHGAVKTMAPTYYRFRVRK